MPDFSDSFDPYATPVDVKVPATAGPTPGGLKAICIIAIVLGSLGALAALVSGVGLVAGQSMQAAMNPNQPGGGDEGMLELQEKMQAEMNEVANRFIIPNTAATLLHLLTAVLLLVGAIMTLQRKGLGPSILTFACAACILYVVGYGILNAMIQMQMIPIVESFMGDMMAEAAKQGGDGADQMPNMSKLATVFIFVALGFGALLALVKIAFYLFAIVYLRKPNIQALFQS